MDEIRPLGPESLPKEPTRIGPYTILEELGSGGMGRVFLAEQHEPIHRRVAVKVMKTSLAGPEAVARFSAERQAMARLGHPNVARIFDGGTTDDGNPFFVMEHVPGESITAYCDRESLPVEERLRLFREACAGVQHAHFHQILHRDLKPSNILVSEVDGEPMVKIIDFGIAKALDDHPLVDEALETGDRILGTPAYMSPEALRAEESGGAGPFETGSGVAGVVRQACEGDLPKPSRKVSSMSDELLSGVADRRRVKPAELSRWLSGDLDAIVRKAIARDPDERYGSAAELAAEVERHLAHEPVLAGPRTLLRYRFGKLVRRHTMASVAATIALGALLAGVAGTTYGLFRARHEAEMAREARSEEERARKEAEEVGRFLVDLFEISDPEKARGRDVTARELLDRGAERIGRELAEQPAVRARMMVSLGKIYTQLGLHAQAVPLLEESLQLRRDVLGERHLDVAESLIELGVTYREEGRLDEAEKAVREGMDLQEVLLGERAPELVGTLCRLASIHTGRGDFARSEELLLRALDLAERADGPVSPRRARVSSALGACYGYQGLFSKAEPLFRRALAINEEALGGSSPRLSRSMPSFSVPPAAARRPPSSKPG